jgi:hypothetical protein
MMGNDEDRGRSRRLGAEDRDDQAQAGYSVAGRLGGWVTLCAIHIIHVEEMRSAGFSV